MTVGDDKGKVDIGISIVGNHYVITYLGVEKFLLDIPQDKHWLGGEMRWDTMNLKRSKGDSGNIESLQMAVKYKLYIEN